VIARGIGSIVLLVPMLRGQRLIHLPRFFKGIKWNIIGRIIRIGVFSTLRSLSLNISRLVLVRIVAVFGTYAVAAFGIGMRLRIFILMLGFGLGDAAAVLMGQNLGASEPGRAEKSTWLAVGFYGCFLVLMVILFLTFPRVVIGIFNTHPQVLSIGGSFLRFFALSLLFIDLGIILGRALSGAGDTFVPMVVTSASLIVIGIPLVWLFSRLWGVTGAWAAIAVSEVIQGLGMVIWFQLGRWKLRKV
jgi:Na+-driven multidrug efflux pump